MATRVPMPARGEPAAPTNVFQTTKPKTLTRYFKDLEFLLGRAGIEDDQLKKQNATRLAPPSEEDAWEELDEFSDETKTWDEFKEAVRKFHFGEAPAAVEKYNLKDLMDYRSRSSQKTMRTIYDYNEYHRKYAEIARFLKSKSLIADPHINQHFIEGLPEDLRKAVRTKLEVLHPLVNPTDYTVDQVDKAARFVLESTRSSNLDDTPSSTTVTTIKTEDLNLVIDSSINAAVQNMRQILQKTTPAPPQYNTSGSGTNSGTYNPNAQRDVGNAQRKCYFCDGADHGIRDCLVRDEYIRVGKCEKDSQNRLVLPNGQSLPRGPLGSSLKSRFDDFYTRNPSALPAAAGGTETQPTLMFSLATASSGTPYVPIGLPTFSQSVSSSIPSAAPTPVPTLPTRRPLSRDERIAALESELAQLRHSEPISAAPVFLEQPQDADRAGHADKRKDAQKAREERAAKRNPEASTQEKQASPPTSRIEEVEDEGEKEEEALKGKEKEIPAPVERGEMPEHPYSASKAPTYLPPTAARVGAPPPNPKAVQPKAQRNDPAYRSLPPVYDPAHADAVFQQSMQSPVTLTQQQLLSISPELRNKIRDTILPKRQPISAPDANAVRAEPVLTLADLGDTDLLNLEPTSPSRAPPLHDLPAGFESTVLLHPMFLQAAHLRPECLPNGAVRLADPCKQYMAEHPDGELAPLHVGSDAENIRELDATLDNKGTVNCILDPGCSIIAMSSGVAHEFGIAYDTSFRIPLESANGKVNWSLGLARDVPFQVQTLTLYLQVHVISTPAYDVLFGRPFDVLGATCIQNYRDARQTVTVNDPNSNRTVTIPTRPRSMPKFRGPELTRFRRDSDDSN